MNNDLMAFRLNTNLRREIEAQAKHENISTSDVIRKAVIKYLREETAKRFHKFLEGESK